MKIHYRNQKGEEKIISNIIHLQNVNNITFIATNYDGKEYTLKISGIESIYYKDDNNGKKSNLIPQIIKSKKTSLKAKGLYAILKAYMEIPNFKIYKENMQKLSSDGKTSFNSAWNELVEQEFLKVHKLPSNNGYIDEYELK